MTEVTIYFAEDGTKFDDPLECREYEMVTMAEKIKGEIVCLDSTKKQIAPIDCLEDGFFVYIKTEKALQWVKDCGDFQGMTSEEFKETGAYLYDDTKGWLKFDDVIKDLEELKSNMIQMVGE